MPLSNRHLINILIIEDTPGDYRLLEIFFREAGLGPYALHHHETLSDGIAHLRQHDVDIVLLDLSLPDSIGIDTIKRLSLVAESVPIVVLTGLSAEEESIGIRSIKEGAQDFLCKEDLNGPILSRTVRYAIERHQMSRLLEQAQHVANMGSWELDFSTNTFRCTAPLYRIFGRQDTGQLMSLEGYLNLVHVDDQTRVASAIMSAYQEQGELNVDHRACLPDGGVRHIALQGKMERGRSNGSPRMMGTVQDITERIRIETLTREKELANKAAKLRQEFLAKTSHEIRTPLNPILVLTDMLLRTELNQEQREYLDIIRTASDTLLALVNDILDLSKIEAGKIEFGYQPFKLSKVFDSIREMMEINAKEKALSLDMMLDPRLPDVLVGDSVRLTQILLNLVGNAIKFTHEGRITVTAKQEQETRGRVDIVFAVEDTGIGIPQDKLKVIFESFQQLDGSVNRKHGGTGLGLTIVRQLVSLQGGYIEVESNVGRGSTFRFHLSFDSVNEQVAPLAPQKSVATPLGGQRRPKAPLPHNLDTSLVEGLTVLLVEDNPLNQMVTKKLLDDWGILVDVANNGREGVDMVIKKMYDLILMDIQMPEMDGYEATEFIRQKIEAPTSQTPIIALTANAFSGSDDKCLQVGMNDYLSKPIEIGNLFDKIVLHIQAQAERISSRMAAAPDLPPGNLPVPASADSSSTSVATPTPSSSDSMQHQSYTDLSYLSELSGGESSMIKAAVEKFISSTPEMLDRLDEHLGSADYAQLAKAAHKLKSSVAFMGIEVAREAIIRVESISKSGSDKMELYGLVSHIREVVEQSFTELEEAVRSM